MKRQWGLLWCGWTLFVVSLALPAGIVDMGAWNNPDHRPVPGWLCMIVAWPFYPSNGLMLLSPLLMWFKKRRSTTWIRLTLVTLFVGSFAGAVVGNFLFPFLETHIGTVLWVISFAVVSIAMWMKDKEAQSGDS